MSLDLALIALIIGPLANFAGFLHMTMHSLTKSAIFFSVGHIAQVKGTKKIADIGGLTEDSSGGPPENCRRKRLEGSRAGGILLALPGNCANDRNGASRGEAEGRGGRRR